MFDQRGPADRSAGGRADGPVGASEDGLSDAGVPGVPVLPVPSSALDVIGMRNALASMVPADAEVEAVDRIRMLETLKAACAAAQARATATLDARRRQDEAARGLPVGDRGRGVSGEVALARRDAPNRGIRHVRLARALVDDMPQTMAALTRGTISEAKATILYRETAWLPSEARKNVDESIADRLGVLGERQLAREVRGEALRQDPLAAAEHFAQAVSTRRVTLRPAQDGMAYLTALLPAVQAAACHTALREQAARQVATGAAEGRSPQQVMTDTLVERLTGQASADDVPLEVHLVMQDSSLLGDDSTPAWIPGHGPVPAGSARRLLADTDADAFLRRLYTAPDTGQLVAMDSKRRVFPRLLRRMVILRDDTCRTPYCDAPIRHLDHATPHRDGGATSWENASGLCVRCNHTKEHPGWRHRAGPEDLEVTTPTGHRYHHPARPLVPA